MTVLFNSSRPLGRCENLTAIWNAYEGKKTFNMGGFGDVSRFSDCDVVVTDEFIRSKRKSQTVVMVEHGLCGGKKYGLDQPYGVFYPEACNLVDYFIASSERGREFAASAAGIPIERCLAFGMPRTDAYFGKKKGDGGTFLAGYERAYLFAPTFRARWEPPMPRVDWLAVDEKLEDGEVFVIKRHMITGEPILNVQCEHIVEVDKDEPSTPYLIDCDVAITDYSSIVLDAYVLGKSSVMFAPDDDLAAYEKARGFYLDYSEYGHIRCKSGGSLVLSARLACDFGTNDVEKRCMEITADACDGHSTERVVDLIRGLA